MIISRFLPFSLLIIMYLRERYLAKIIQPPMFKYIDETCVLSENPYQDYVDKFKKVQDMTRSYFKKILEDEGIDDEFKDDIKNRESCERKLNSRASKDYKILRDIYRTSIIVEKCSDIKNLLKRFFEDDFPFRVVELEFKDYIDSASYSDISLVLMTRDLLVFEMQLHLRSFYDIKSDLHSVYEKARKTDSKLKDELKNNIHLMNKLRYAGEDIYMNILPIQKWLSAFKLLKEEEIKMFILSIYGLDPLNPEIYRPGEKDSKGILVTREAYHNQKDRLIVLLEKALKQSKQMSKIVEKTGINKYALKECAKSIGLDYYTAQANETAKQLDNFSKLASRNYKIITGLIPDLKHKLEEKLLGSYLTQLFNSIDPIKFVNKLYFYEGTHNLDENKSNKKSKKQVNTYDPTNFIDCIRRCSPVDQKGLERAVVAKCEKPEMIKLFIKCLNVLKCNSIDLLDYQFIDKDEQFGLNSANINDLIVEIPEIYAIQEIVFKKDLKRYKNKAIDFTKKLFDKMRILLPNGKNLLALI